MAVIAYIGNPGAGKSHEVVKNVIVKKVLEGRRVLTNIEGIKTELLYEYCREKTDKDSVLGSVVEVTPEQFKDPLSWPEYEKGKTKYDTLVQPGDIVIVDEAWDIWGTAEKLNKRHMTFFRMHRHMRDEETNFTSDLVVVTQDIGDLNKSLKAIVQTTFRMSKMVELGMNNSYRVEIFQGTKLWETRRLSKETHSYDPNIYALYDSHAGGGGKETVVDKRVSIFAPKKLITFVVLILFLFGCGGYALSTFFRPPAAKASTATPAAESRASVPDPKLQDRVVAAAPAKPVPKQSTTWRLAGTRSDRNGTTLILVNVQGTIRQIAPDDTWKSERGRFVSGTVDGEIVSAFAVLAPAASTGTGIPSGIGMK
jgi:zona occludens toxin